jgi:hypothetical protein
MPEARPEVEQAELRGRLNAFREIHEFWEFEEDMTEDQFDAWLHAEIKKLRKLVEVGR